jgi:prophage regulatory protein
MTPEPQTSPSDADRLIQVKEVIRLTSVSRTQLHRLVKAGSFPRPCKIGAARKAWSLEEVRRWIAERRAESRALPIQTVDADGSLPWEE